QSRSLDLRYETDQCTPPSQGPRLTANRWGNHMSWGRIMAPLSGGESDKNTITAASMLAEPFGAELAGIYTPADIADVMPWMGEGFLGGVQTTALESLKEATAAGEASAKKALAAVKYAKKQFIALQTPVWAGLSAESRLSDVVVFTSDAARRRGPRAAV